MSGLRELYQETILDHNKSPKNFRRIEGAGHSAEGYNPLCGDRVTVYVELDGESIRDVSFEGQGCAICTASASMMTEAVKGRARGEADELFQKFHRMVTEEDGASNGADLGKLAVFEGVREYPMRVKCSTLPWHTFHAALEGADKSVTTE